MDPAPYFFTPDDEEQLIEYVKGYPPLFDLKHGEYKDAEMKGNIWRDISDAMGKNEDACRLKWKNIRDWYHRKKKDSRLPSGSGAFAVRMRKRYQHLAFLDTLVESRSIISNIPNIKDEESSTNNSESADMYKEDYLIDVQKSEINDDIEVKTEPVPTPEDMSPRRKKAKTLRQQFHQPEPERMGTLMHTVVNHTTFAQKNAMESFFSAMAATVLELPRDLQIRVKHQISNIVFEAEAEVASSLYLLQERVSPQCTTASITSSAPDETDDTYVNT